MTNSDFPTDQTFHQFHEPYTELDLHRIISGFHGTFATDVASQQGTLTLPDTWFRPPLWDLHVLQLLRPDSWNLPCLYSTFHLEYPLVLSRFCFLNFIYDTYRAEFTKERYTSGPRVTRVGIALTETVVLTMAISTTLMSYRWQVSLYVFYLITYLVMTKMVDDRPLRV